MRKLSVYRIGVAVASVLFVSFFISACANKTTAQEKGQKTEQKTEQAGVLRQQLMQYVSSLPSVTENSNQNQKIREKIIALAQEIKPAPAIPNEVAKYEGRAEAAVSLAKTPADFLDAAKEYKKALFVAPWVAKLYFNLATVLEKAEKPKEAIRNFNLYLLAAPDAPDKTEVQKKISGLEYGMEKAANEQVAEQQKKIADENLAAQLVGIWHSPPSGGSVNGFRLRIEVNGTKVQFICIATPVPNSSGTFFHYVPTNNLWVEGEIKEGRLVGIRHKLISTPDEGVISVGTEPYDNKIEVSDDGQMFKYGDIEGWDPEGDNGRNTSYIFLKE